MPFYKYHSTLAGFDAYKNYVSFCFSAAVLQSKTSYIKRVMMGFPSFTEALGLTVNNIRWIGCNEDRG
ncbi:MAG: hypothetical protein AM325_004705 [Candidatus Thorarchaeota archaeon SMTZ1-45]